MSVVCPNPDCKCKKGICKHEGVILCITGMVLVAVGFFVF